MKKFICLILSLITLLPLISCSNSKDEVSRLNALIAEKTEQLEEIDEKLELIDQENAQKQSEITSLTEEKTSYEKETEKYKDATKGLTVTFIQDDFLLRVKTDKLAYAVGETITVTCDLIYIGEEEFVIPPLPDENEEKPEKVKPNPFFDMVAYTYEMHGIYLGANSNEIDFTKGVVNSFLCPIKAEKVGNMSIPVRFSIWYPGGDPYWPDAFWHCEGIAIEGILVFERI